MFKNCFEKRGISMKLTVFELIESVINLFSAWLFVDVNKLGWCPVKVDTREERY